MIRADARVVEPRWSRDLLAPSYRVGETRYAYALQVLARLFGGSETSRLWRALVVDGKLALSASAGYSPASLGLTSFDIAVHPAPARSVAEIEAAVSGEMKKLLDGGVTRGRGRAGAEPAPGRRDLFPGFAGERAAPLRRHA